MLVRRLRLSLVVMVALVGAGSVASAAPPAWAPSATLFAPGVRYHWDVSVGTGGRAIVASVRDRGKHGLPEIVERAAAGLPWTLPQALPSPPSLLPPTNDGPRILLNRRGDALAVWRASDNRTLVSTARPRGGRWTRAKPVPDLGFPYAFGLTEDGRAWGFGIACSAGRGCRTRTFVSTGPGGPWRKAGGDVALPGMQSGTVPAVAGDAAVIAWRTNGPTPEIRAATRRPGARRWEAPRSISAPSRLPGPYGVSVDVGELGDVAVIWANAAPASGGPSESSGIEVAVRPRGAGWRGPQQLLAPGLIGAERGRVSVDADGSMLATWLEVDPDATSRLSVAVRSAGGRWEAPTTLVTQDPVRGDGWMIPVPVDAPPTLRAGRAFVPWTVNFGMGLPTRSGTWFRDRSSPEWRAVAPFDPTGEGFTPSAVGFDGTAIAVDYGPGPAGSGRLGLVVREFTDRSRPPRTRVRSVQVGVRGRTATIAITLAGAGRLVGSVWRRSHRVRTFATPVFPSGRHSWSLAFAPGDDRLDLAVCGLAEGCRDLAPSPRFRLPTGSRR
jgi:hypothetical protein